MSELEELFLAVWVCIGGPRPVREFRFAPGRRYRFDFAWPDARVALEIDGGQWLAHGGRHNTDEDRRKLNLAAALGWRVFRASGDMLRDDPLVLAEQIKRAMEVTR